LTDRRERPLVVDASAALAWIQEERWGNRVLGLIQLRRHVIVPWLFWYEVANILGRRRRWPAARVTEALYGLDRLGLETRLPDRPSLLQAVDAVEWHALSAYDAAYLVLAEQEDADVLTGDAELAAAAGARAIPVAPPHRLAEAAARYEAHVNQRPAQRETWPGAAAHLQALRRQVEDERRIAGRARSE
jgi:predicted nucleic acid-binding protein